MQNFETAVLLPCYKRKDYTEKCLRALEVAQPYENTIFHLVDDGSNDGTAQILRDANLDANVEVFKDNVGLRQVIISFIELYPDVTYISMMDNDCLVPPNWLNDILHKFDTTDADILSPNVMPSNAAYKFGSEDRKGRGYRPAQTVGGLWTMRRSLLDDIFFEHINCRGIIGAYQILRQIIVEKQPKVGWLPDITVDDMGHWSGAHPEHIKSDSHKEYSKEIGRTISW